MAAPCVYVAIHAIARDLAKVGIGKDHTNSLDGYSYRSIDDVLNRLSPLLAKHRLSVFPRTLERVVAERCDENDHLLISVALKVAYTFVSVDDASTHEVHTHGEALDGGDKATAKAMSAAYKAAMVQTFCIPTGAGEDPERASHRLKRRVELPEPVQGWERWVEGTADILAVCQSDHAIDLVQDRNRDLINALRREKPELYKELGEAFASVRERLSVGRANGHLEAGATVSQRADPAQVV